VDTRISLFRSALDARPTSAFQVRLLAMAFLLMLLDGYDTQAIGYVAPVLTGLWQLDRSSFGPVFSSGLVGLTLGAMIFGPIADRFGARRVLLACTAMYGVLTLATASVASLEMLLALRFVTGLGLGGAMPVAVALVSDYAPSRTRNLMVAIAICGFSLGGAAGGLVAAATIARFGWGAVFVIGGVLPLLLLPVLIIGLPESLERLLAHPSPRHRLKKVLARAVPGWIVPAALTDRAPEVFKSPVTVRQLFAAGYVMPTLLIWIVFACNLLLLFFLANWIPTVAYSSGLPLEAANLAAAIYQMGGTVGAFVLAMLCDRFARPQVVLATAFSGAALSCFLIGQSSADMYSLFLSAAGAGFCVVGGQITADAFVTNYYPSAARATGIGWALGVGRLGSIAGPLIGGVLIGLKIPTPTLFAILAIPALLACVSVISIRSPNEPGEPDTIESSKPHRFALGRTQFLSRCRRLLGVRAS
jgi:MFS transporter, AAHS family, 4-hydroxybenzoate transporter